MKIIGKITLYEIEHEGNIYRRSENGNWEQLFGQSWEDVNPWEEEKLEKLFWGQVDKT